MPKTIDSGYPRLTKVSDWPAGSREAGRIAGGDEVYITGPQFEANGELHHPVFIKPMGWTGATPWSSPYRKPITATIYFIGPANGPIKIGYASRIDARLRGLRLANAFPLEIWATVEGPLSLERDYHRQFAAHRLHGEWFERCSEIEAEIARLNLSPPPATRARPDQTRMEVRHG